MYKPNVYDDDTDMYIMPSYHPYESIQNWICTFLSSSTSSSSSSVKSRCTSESEFIIYQNGDCEVKFSLN